jgi:hypothetical protein
MDGVRLEYECTTFLRQAWCLPIKTMASISARTETISFSLTKVVLFNQEKSLGKQTISAKGIWRIDFGLALIDKRKVFQYLYGRFIQC